MARLLQTIPLVLVLAAGAAAQNAAAPQPATGAAPSADDLVKKALKPGSKAPALKVAGWIKGDAVPEFKEGQAYVVEGWATWCGPCRMSIPHLTELQKKYGDKVTFIGVSMSEQDWDGVTGFVKEMGDQMEYRVAIDKTGEFSKNWMDAAMQSGIPTAFVVNQDGKVAWIGHPMELDGVLPDVVAKTWDLAKAQSDAEADLVKQAKQAAAEQRGAPITEKIRKAWQAGKKEEAMAYVDELIAIDPETFAEPAMWKAEVLMLDLGKIADGQAYIKKLADGPYKDQPEALNTLAWNIVGSEKATTHDLDLALRIIKRADELTKGTEANVKDTLARTLFLKGDIDGAIATQEAAIKLLKNDDESVTPMKANLETYKAAKK